MLTTLKPVATATPDGNLKVARQHRWIPERKLAEIESIEEEYRQRIAATLDRQMEAKHEAKMLELYCSPGFFDNSDELHGQDAHIRAITPARTVQLRHGCLPNKDGKPQREREARSMDRAKPLRKKLRRSSSRYDGAFSTYA